MQVFIDYHSSPQSSFSLLGAFVGIVDETPVAAVVVLTLEEDVVEDDGVCLKAVVPMEPDCRFCWFFCSPSAERSSLKSWRSGW
jgi:hypothetical protein